MDGLLHDLRIGFRMLLRTPLLSIVAVLTVGLGVGATSFAFSVVYGTLVRGLPVPDPDRVMLVQNTRPAEGPEGFGISPHDFFDYREQQSSFESLGGGYTGTVNIGGLDGPPERYQGGFFTAEMLSMLGVPPLHGRMFDEADNEPGAPALLLLGYRAWQNRFGADPAVVGSAVRVNGETATVIGVMPDGFRFAFDEDVWVPLRVDPGALERGGGVWMNVAGRLREGVSVEAANQDIAAISARIAEAWPEQNEGMSTLVQPYTEGFMPAEITTMMVLLMVMVTGVLLVACANVANILLARAVARGKEVAIRSALGAKRGRVIRQLLAEAAALGIAGGIVGVAISWVSLAVFTTWLVDVEKPYWIAFELDGVALLFTSAVTLAAALVAGTVPAIRASGTKLDTVLRDETRGSSSLRVGRFTTSLVVAELAVSCGLMIGAGLLIRALVDMNRVDLGFETEDVMTARLGLFPTDYPDSLARSRFFELLLDRVREEPGIAAAALTTTLPAVGQSQWPVRVEGETYPTDGDVPRAGGATVSAGFFETFAVPMLEGRELDVAEVRAGGDPVVVVNRSFGEQRLGGGSAVGRRIAIGAEDSEEPWMRIVGVVPDLFEGSGDFGSGDQIREAIYLPLGFTDPAFISIAVRSRGPAADIAGTLRGAVMDLDPNLPLYFVRPIQQAIDETRFLHRIFGVLFAIFGASALFLAAVGLYGVIDFSVSSRLREMGLRMALGAEGGDILGMVFRRVMIQLAVGGTLGVGLGALLARPLAATLFGVQSWDALVYFGIVGTLALTGVVAALFPALRAIRVDPVVALRA